MKRRFVLDTNVLLTRLRAMPLADDIWREFDLSGADAVLIVPSAVAAELKSIALQQGHGMRKIAQLESLLNSMTIIHTNSDIIEAYVEIDAFSQGKHPSRPLETSHRNMGKNDLWIAATAKVANATLLTFDKDFDHLSGVLLSVHRFDLNP
ncbi:MAG: hypothetical protein OHK0039_08220 [Bacteroidia bacterium]